MRQSDFKCPNHNHHSAPLLFICLEPKCKLKRKSCVHCADQLHSKHDLVSIDKFLNQVNAQLQKHNTHPQKIQINNFLKIIRNDFSKSFAHLKSRIAQAIQKIELKINDLFFTAHQLLIANASQVVQNHIFSTFMQTEQVIEDYLVQSNRFKNIQLGSFKDVRRKLQDYLYSFQEASYVFQSDLAKAMKNLEKQASMNCLAPTKESQNPAFSEINKAPCILLQDSKKILQHLSANYNYTVCCLEKPLTYSNSWFCLRIDKNPHKKIWIGACSLSTVKKNNFVNCFGVGKGTYALDQTGTNSFDGTNYAAVSSHHEFKKLQGPNPYIPKWNFQQGDLVYVRMDPIGSLLSIYLLNQAFNPEGTFPQNNIYTQSYSLEMKFTGTDIYGFVGLNGMGGDQVTLLSKSELDKIVAVYGDKWLMFTGEMEELDDEDDW